MKDYTQMVTSIDFYKIFHFIKLLQCFWCCYLFILIFICYYFWLLFGLIGFLGSTIVISITSAILLLRVSCPLSIFSRPIAGKDITTSMSKSMYSSMSVLEKKMIKQFPKLCINLITLFKTTKTHPKSTRIPLHIFKKTQKYRPKTHKKKKWQLKRLILLLPLQFPCFLQLLSQRSSIVCLTEVPCLQRCVDFHYWWRCLTCERE